MSIQELKDDHGRVIRDVRISLTDRCNFRCLYCLPETEEAANFYRSRWSKKPGLTLSPVSSSTDAASSTQTDSATPATSATPISKETALSKPIAYSWKPKAELLTYEEIERVTRLMVRAGVQKVRLTGGEPLLRRHVPALVSQLSQIDGIIDLALTTNGFHFVSQAQALKQAGLQRISFSLDSLDRENFRKLTGRDGLDQVLESIRVARELGLDPVKVNAVIIRDMNDHEIPDLAEFALENRLSMRFIEFMPLDSKRAWQKDLVVSGKEVIERIQSRFALEPVRNPDNPSETAKRWRFVSDTAVNAGHDSSSDKAEIGIIAPVSEPFCGHCNRLRLTADGKIRTCLFSLIEHDLRALLRGGETDNAILEWLAAVVRGKEAGHRIGHKDFVQPARTMSCIGG
jgi:cyclic pyranopterin phosphate synthase